jgi:hypothetical protein
MKNLILPEVIEVRERAYDIISVLNIRRREIQNWLVILNDEHTRLTEIVKGIIDGLQEVKLLETLFIVN